MIVLLCVSVLAFFTLYERENNGGVVGNVRYIVDSRQDGVKELTFYFVEKGLTKSCSAVDDASGVTFTVEDCEYVYRYDTETGEVTATPESPDAFSVYSEKLFKRIVDGSEKFMKFWQAGVVALICLCGGMIIFYAEEIWLQKHKKDGREPVWSDMNGIKALGGGVIALGVIVMILFIIF